MFILICSNNYTLFFQTRVDGGFYSRIDPSCSKISSKYVAMCVLELKSPNNIIGTSYEDLIVIISFVKYSNTQS